MLEERKRRRWCTWPPRTQVRKSHQQSFHTGKSFLFLSSLICGFVHFFLRHRRVWQTWNTAVWGGGQSAAFQEENSDSDWCPGCGEAETEEQASALGSTSVRHHHPMYGLSGFHYYSTLHFLGFNYNYNFNSAGRKSESAAAVCVFITPLSQIPPGSPKRGNTRVGCTPSPAAARWKPI